MAHVCTSPMCHQWQCQSGRALGPPGPGRHCSTVMSPLPVQGWEGEGEFGRAGKNTDQQNCVTKGKKRAGRRSLVWIPNQSPHSWLNSAPPSSFVDWTNKQDKRAERFEQNSISEHSWQPTVFISQIQTKAPKLLSITTLEKIRAKVYNLNFSLPGKHVCVSNRNSTHHLVGALCSWAPKVTVTYVLQMFVFVITYMMKSDNISVSRKHKIIEISHNNSSQYFKIYIFTVNFGL